MFQNTICRVSTVYEFAKRVKSRFVVEIVKHVVNERIWSPLFTTSRLVVIVEIQGGFERPGVVTVAHSDLAETE